MSGKKWWLTAAAAASAALIFGGIAIWRAQRVLRDTRERVAGESRIRFTARPIAAAIPAGLEIVGAPAAFVAAQVFHQHLFIAGPTGLDEFDESGTSVARYRVGAELPPAPITSLAVGLAGDSRAPELWMGTAGEGLVAFDGRGFRQIKAEEARYRKITAVLALATGRIVAGTEKAGVLVYDGRELRPFHVSLEDARVTALAGTDASLWVGTIDRGLLHLNAGALEAIDEALPDRQVLSIAMDGDAVYAGTALGIAEIAGGKFTRVIAPGYFAQALLAEGGKLWMGTLNEGMVEVSRDSRQDRLPHPALNVCGGCSVHRVLRMGGEVYTLAADSLWRGTEQVLRREDAVLADRNIAALRMDGSGRLWIGYFDRGLQILDSGEGRGETFEDDHLFCVNRIAHDAGRGISAVATANGLVMFDAAHANRRVITKEDGLIANQVTDVVLRADGTSVAATPAGISFIDSGGISSLYAFQGLVNNHVYALAADGARTLAGTLGGLSVLDGSAVKASFTTANSSLKHNWITGIVRVGDEWFVGTYGAGVLKTDALGRWRSFEDLRGEIDINANAMTATVAAVYAGTLDRGLAVYGIGSGRWNFFTAGLPSRNVTAVEARGGMVYIGTDNGLVRIPETALVNR
jgi:ligand-binding sensor domain-containing protein